jgi:tRNA A37 threonylcarbamoyladenosine modification protein TsaB
MPNVDVVVIELSSPILVGVYQDTHLIQTLSSDLQSSEALPALFKDILDKYEIDNIVYTRGPGSFMAIKVAYIFLQTLCIVNKCKLFATNAFTFNQSQPIKAFGKLYFIQSNGTITTQKFEEPIEAVFELPKTINLSDYSEETTPLYVLPAV